MSGGGGGGFQPQDNSMQIAAMQRQWALDDERRAEERKAKEEGDFNKALADAVSSARTTGLNYLGERGLASDQYGSVIDQIIADSRLKVPKLDTNPGQYFTTDAFASGLNNYQNLKRGNFNSQVQGAFAPGFESSYIPDSSVDSIINDILGVQSGQAQQQLDFQRKRGLLNDAGWNDAQQRFGEQQNAARSTLQGLGTAELGKDRQSLIDIVGNAGNAANAWSLGNPAFSVDPYRGQVQQRANTEIDKMGGDIRSALGSTQLFDIPSIIASAGAAQGPQNLTTVNTAPGVPFNQRKNNQNRGLGSTGTF